MPHEVIMPALGMAQDKGVIVCWRKALGDAVAVGDPLFDVETDKTTMEVEAAHEGYLTEIRAAAGADIPIGETIALITEALGGAGLGLVPDTPKAAASRDKPAAPSTLSAVPTAPSTSSVAPTVPILASPKAKFEAHRRGIDLRRLVDRGFSQPFHVADLDRLKPETGPPGPLLQASVLTAAFAWSSFKAFIAWAEEKTGRLDMREPALAAFAAAALRAAIGPDDEESLAISVLSIKAETSEILFLDADLQGLGSLAQSPADGADARADLTLIDLSGTRLIDYRPTPPPRCPSIAIADRTEKDAIATLHFCEDRLSLLAAARILDGFAARVAEPALQLM